VLRAPTDGHVIRITWIGHSTVLLELDGARVLTDPVLRKRVAHLRRVEGPDAQVQRDVDAVLVSHIHHDHLDLPSLRLHRSWPVVVPRGAGPFLERHGLQALELEIGEETHIGALTVRATLAEHHARRGGLGFAAPAIGYLICGSSRIYFAGDTDLFEGMRDLAPGLDVALLPVAGWGPRVPAGHLDSLRAAQALSLLQPRVAIPIHWGTYRTVGSSRDASTLREPAEEFKRLAAELAPQVDVRVLPVGGSVDVELDVSRIAQRDEVGS